MRGGCRRVPPSEVCETCFEVNGQCTEHCRDAFVYDESRPDDEKIQILKERYVEGNKGGNLTMGVKIPERLLKSL